MATPTASELAQTRPFAVVTGGTEGLGAAIAERLARTGTNLLIIARREAELAATATRLRSLGAPLVATLALDLTDAEAPARLDAVLRDAGGHVDMLVNNAGIGHCGAFADAAPALLDRLNELNVIAPTRLMRHVLPGMRARRCGSIINIASMGGFVPGPYQAAYYASKAYLLSLSEAVAAEVRADGVRVTVVAPGPIETAFHARMDAESALYRRLLPQSSPESVARWALFGQRLGMRVVVPGLHNAIAAGLLRILPHALLIPIMAFLLEPNQKDAGGATPHV